MGGIPYELHLHSCLSPCGDPEMTPSSIAGMAMLNGVRVAALTDHNTCKNCPAFFEACHNYGVIPIAGMELTTMEEIHMVCLFDSLDAAMDFDKFLAGHRMKIKNRPDIFGEQLIMDVDDCVIGIENDLLILATDLELTVAANAVRSYGGAAFPAHIDKQANSVIGVLGTFPKDPGFCAAEFHDAQNIERYKTLFPQLSGLRTLINSDAHALDQMHLSPPILSELEDICDETALRHAVVSFLRE